MKKLLSLTLSAVLLLALLAGCGGKDNSADGGASNSGSSGDAGTITIEYWNSAEGAMATSTEYLVNQFNETVGKEKGIFVNSVFQGGDVVEKLKTLVQANDYKNFPDVGQIYAAGLSTVLKMESLVPLDTIYSSGEYEVTLKKEDIYKNFLRSYTYEGQTISLPLNASTMLMYYNKDAAVAVEQLNHSDPGMQEPLDLINWELNTLCKENFIAWTDGKISKQECHDNIVDNFNAKLTEYIRANG